MYRSISLYRTAPLSSVENCKINTFWLKLKLHRIGKVMIKFLKSPVPLDIKSLFCLLILLAANRLVMILWFCLAVQKQLKYHSKYYRDTIHVVWVCCFHFYAKFCAVLKIRRIIIYLFNIELYWFGALESFLIIINVENEKRETMLNFSKWRILNIFCNNVKFVTVTFEQFSASLLDKKYIFFIF